MIARRDTHVLKKWWQRVLVTIVVSLLRLYWSTLRIKLTEGTKKVTDEIRGPAIFAFWHSNLFVAYKLFRLLKRKCGMYALVSPSRDGAWLTEMFNRLGIQTIRGSSNRNGLSAIDNMAEKLSKGALVAITPDGPRGPAYKFKKGTAMVAKATKANLVLVAPKYNHYFVLPTWDKFKIPLPFSKICVETKTFPKNTFEDLTARELSTVLENELTDLQQKN
ncbi:MAG: lysophospholipid acyltransferase family protein [Puniceicoccales bacterium]|jgi:lysophospholipid acyltransferase (LPLAT)-like uncharacterized protein|nr:lysophospholipid acyltransferase family protein [Puniceicoccales bacterium]